MFICGYVCSKAAYMPLSFLFCRSLFAGAGIFFDQHVGLGEDADVLGDVETCAHVVTCCYSLLDWWPGWSSEKPSASPIFPRRKSRKTSEIWRRWCACFERWASKWRHAFGSFGHLPFASGEFALLGRDLPHVENPSTELNRSPGFHLSRHCILQSRVVLKDIERSRQAAFGMALSKLLGTIATMCYNNWIPWVSHSKDFGGRQKERSRRMEEVKVGDLVWRSSTSKHHHDLRCLCLPC